MGCLTMTDYPLGCEKETGGVIEVYLAELLDVESITETAGEVTAITMASGTQFYTYKVIRENSDWTEAYAGVRENRTNAWTQTLRFNLHTFDAPTKLQVDNLSNGIFVAIVKEENGYHLLGKVTGLEMSTNTLGQSGILKEDMQGYAIELEGKEASSAPTVDETIVSALLTA